jgi:hypothetical protein
MMSKKNLSGGLLAAALVFGTAPAAENDCCSCKVRGAKTFADKRLPCLFDYPETWSAVAGSDGALVSGIATPASCDTICPNGTPAMTMSFGDTPDSNADTMEQIWRQIMPVVGSGRCGEGTVTFFSPPGSDASSLIGGVKFYVSLGGKKYGGAATFTCGEPGGWLELQKLFVDSFRGNPESSFAAN